MMLLFLLRPKMTPPDRVDLTLVGKRMTHVVHWANFDLLIYKQA